MTTINIVIFYDNGRKKTLLADVDTDTIITIFMLKI